MAVVRYGLERVLKQADVNETTECSNLRPFLARRRARPRIQTSHGHQSPGPYRITIFRRYFVICTGANQRQIQTIGDEVNLQMKRQTGELPLSVEGYTQAEWVLADYGDFAGARLLTQGAPVLRPGAPMAERPDGGNPSRARSFGRRVEIRRRMRVFVYFDTLGRLKPAPQ